MSYAQNFEDVMLRRALRDVEHGFYIDIGAFDPIFDSVSMGFYEQGWRGIHVEPVAEYARLLRDMRPDETVLDIALAEETGKSRLHLAHGTGMSTLSAAWGQRAQAAGFTVSETLVVTSTLDHVLAGINRDIHWLKIDVEGAEGRVLSGWTGCDNLPWIVVVESVAPDGITELHAEWEPLLLAKQYTHVYFDGLNRFYLAPARRALAEQFRYGPSIWDDFQFPESSRRCADVVRSLRGAPDAAEVDGGKPSVHSE